MNVFDVLREKVSEISELVRPVGWSRKIEIIETKAVMEIINQVEQQYNNGWIPAEQPPKDNKPVLLHCENFSIPLVGRYEEDEKGGAYHIGDEDETLVSQGIFVTAWQPLPEKYDEEEGKILQREEA